MLGLPPRVRIEKYQVKLFLYEVEQVTQINRNSYVNRFFLSDFYSTSKRITPFSGRKLHRSTGTQKERDFLLLSFYFFPFLFIPRSIPLVDFN